MGHRPGAPVRPSPVLDGVLGKAAGHWLSSWTSPETCVLSTYYMATLVQTLVIQWATQSSCSLDVAISVGNRMVAGQRG